MIKFEEKFYQAIVVGISTNDKNYIKNYHYVNYNNDNFYKATKVVVLPNYFCGKIINYIVDYFQSCEICSFKGIPSRGGGWHEPPAYKKGFEKNSYYTGVYTPELFENLFGGVTFKEI